MSVDTGGTWRRVSEILLNQAKVHPCFKQMGGPRVTKSMDRSQFVNAAFFERGTQSLLNTAPRHRLCCLPQVDMPTAFGRKYQDWVAMAGPVLTKQFKSTMWQWDITIFVSLTVTDMDHHARAVDIRDAKMDALLKPQTRR